MDPLLKSGFCVLQEEAEAARKKEVGCFSLECCRAATQEEREECTSKFVAVQTGEVVNQEVFGKMFLVRITGALCPPNSVPQVRLQAPPDCQITHMFLCELFHCW